MPAVDASIWILGRSGLRLQRPAALMGILNATPDSFSDGGRHLDPARAVPAAIDLAAAGAAWLDIGGESSRPGAKPVPEAEELRRVVPLVAALRAAAVAVPISVDTVKPAVARAALEAGANAINDIGGGRDPALLEVAAAAGCPLVLMHMQGDPGTMQRAPAYRDVVDEVAAFLEGALAAAVAAGVREEAVVLDPGIGFGKTPAHNLALLAALPRLAALGRPLLVGVSRKSFLAAGAASTAPPGVRDGLSHLVHARIAPHCALLRVHDVAGASAALRLSAALDAAGVGHG